MRRFSVTPDVLKSILSGMPAEQTQEVLSPDFLKRALSEMPASQTQEVLSSDVLKSILSNMSVKQETINEVLDQISENRGA